jgi:hypothetical protein
MTQAFPRKLITPRAAAALLFVTFCAAYLGDAGHGFIKDDFRWVRETRIASTADVARLFERTDGFYRPLVSLTFALNSATSGLSPRAFGLTNLALAIANAALVWLLARSLGLTAAPALLSAAAWAFNFHGINMAVLWISGRTALMVTLCALLSGIAAAAGRIWLAAIGCLLAMLSKEEAVLLPVVVALWIAYDAHRGQRHRESHRKIGEIREKQILPYLPDLFVITFRRTWPCVAAVAVYLALRLRTDAFWPADAPSYYRLTFSPSLLAANVLQYIDRAITWPAFAAFVTYVASARHARLRSVEKRIAVFGTIWLVCLFALTVFVPVRSSLYAVLPSVGAALAAGAVASAALRTAPRRVTVAMALLTVLPVLLLPVYWRRNERWTHLADLSAHVVEQVRTATHHQPGRPILIVDNPSERFNLDAAFGNLWPDAAALFVPGATTAIVAQEPLAARNTIVLRLEGTELVRR